MLQDIAFQRAAMPRMDPALTASVLPKGVLLNDPVLRWFVNEEEISFAGTIITRSYQRARWYGGRTFPWIGCRRETGRGLRATVRRDRADAGGRRSKRDSARR